MPEGTDGGIFAVKPMTNRSLNPAFQPWLHSGYIRRVDVLKANDKPCKILICWCPWPDSNQHALAGNRF